jgi:hypothetical protein
MNPVINKDVFVALQNIEVASKFAAMPQEDKANLVLGVKKGSTLVIVQKSDSAFVRFFQAIANFFSRISTDTDTANALVTKSFDIFKGKESKVALLLSDVLELNENSIADKKQIDQQNADVRRIIEKQFIQIENLKAEVAALEEKIENDAFIF